MKEAMKNKFFIDLTQNSPGGRLFGDRIFPPHRSIRQAIRRQVMSEYGLQLETATGWKKRWVKWKINMISQMRYREILFSGGYSRVTH